MRDFKVALEVKSCERITEPRWETVCVVSLSEGSSPSTGVGIEAPGEFSLERIELLPTFFNERKALEARDLRDFECVARGIATCSSSCRLSLTTSITTESSAALLLPVPLAPEISSGAESSSNGKSNSSSVQLFINISVIGLVSPLFTGMMD